MFIRKNRQHLHGKTNKDFRTDISKSETNLAQVASRMLNKESQEFQSLRYKNVKDSILKLKRKMPDPIDHSKIFYQSLGKEFKQHADIERQRYGYLEEIELGKKVFTGESNIFCEDKDMQTQISYYHQDEEIEKNHRQSKLILEKHDIHTKADQETQLIALDKYNKETLDGKVDLEKVKEIRRAIRRRYATRKQIQKIFNIWDEDSQGFITVKNIYSMVRKLTLNLNLDEARVLVASIDKENKGYLGLDQFMELIYNENDNFNIDLKSIPMLSKEQEIQLLAAPSEENARKIQIEIEKQNRKKKENQISLVLKNKLNLLAPYCLEQDESRSGTINYEKLETIIKRLQINSNVITDEDIGLIYDKFKIDEHQFDYQKMIGFLKNYSLNTEDLYKEPEKAHKNTHGFQLESKDENSIYILDCNKSDFYQMKKHRQKALKLFQSIKRYIPSEEEFKQFIQQTQKLHEGHVNSKQIIKSIENLFLNVGETFTNQDISSLLSQLKFNKDLISLEKLGCTIYEESEKQYLERVQQQKRADPPLKQQSQFLDSIKEDQQEEYKEMETFYNQKNGMASIGSTLTSDMAQILQKFDDKIYMSSHKMLDVFRKFDKDNDGYVSHQDFVQNIQQYNLFSNRELKKLINYLDPLQKGYVDFKQFQEELYPSMVQNNSFGKQEVHVSPQPNQELNKSLIEFLPNIKSSYDNFKKDLTVIKQEQGKTRFNGNPTHKDTFYISSPPANSGMYLEPEKRYSRDNLNAKIQFQKEEKFKTDSLYSNRLNRIQKREEEILDRISRKQDYALQKEELKIKVQGIAKYNYEQRAHIKNDWQ